jgi:hypothetical protein
MAMLPNKPLFEVDGAEEQEAARLFIGLAAVLREKPEKLPKIRLAAAAMLLRMAFDEHYVPAMRTVAWEDYAYWTRRKIIEELGKRK